MACCVQAMAELVAENARSGNPARTPQELAVALLQGGTPREAVETRLPGLVSTMFGRSGGSGAATETAGNCSPTAGSRLAGTRAQNPLLQPSCMMLCLAGRAMVAQVAAHHETKVLRRCLLTSVGVAALQVNPCCT